MCICGFAGRTWGNKERNHGCFCPFTRMAHNGHLQPPVVSRTPFATSGGYMSAGEAEDLENAKLREITNPLTCQIRKKYDTILIKAVK